MKKPSQQSPLQPPRAPLLAEADLFDQLSVDKSSSLWLGRFGPADIWRMWEQCGFLGALKASELQPLLLRVEAIDAFVQALKLYKAQAMPEHLLAEFRLRETLLAPRKRLADNFGEAMPRVLAIEWLLLQNPYAAFTRARPALPGQTHPGLGQARHILQWLIELAQRLKLEGISNYPEYFHNAYLYQQQFHFYNPERQGMVSALHRDLATLSLAEISWGIERGCVRQATGEVLVWESDLQVLPLSSRVREYFETASYQAACEAARESLYFYFDEKKFRELQAPKEREVTALGETLGT